MPKALKRRAAKAVAQDLGKNRFWIQHAELIDEDLEWVAAAESLTLWNVTMSLGFLARLKNLWWLDIRGGSGTDLTPIRGAIGLRYLQVNQVRGMRDLSVAAELPSLQYISLYGLPRVTELPSFARSAQLEHASLGQLGGLRSLDGILDASNLSELMLLKRINVNSSDVGRMNGHQTLKRFSWFAEDVPVKAWYPVVQKIVLPPVPPQHASDWFKQKSKT